MKTLPEILLVDDDPDIRDSLTIILQSAGFAVRCAANGHEALTALQDRRPDAMILDVMMTTDTEGFDLAFELREQPEYAKLPIVLLTSFLDKVKSGGPGPFQHILGEGWPAAWLFEKPVDPIALTEKLHAVLAESAEADDEPMDD
jgi:DNA-binding response OmpR family regulator